MSGEKKREWVSLLGDFEIDGEKLTCKGGVFSKTGQEEQPRLGIFLTNEVFSDGVIRAEIEFEKITDFSWCDVILSYDPASRDMLLAGISSLGPMYQFAKYGASRELISAAGSGANLKAGVVYSLEITKQGSIVNYRINGIKVLTATLPYAVEESNVGISIMSKTDIVVHSFCVSSVKPKAFVVMQFSDPYNQFYSDIIKTICSDFSVDVKRADENFSTGMVLADIVEDIKGATFVLADISEVNPNVYYEIGYAHALNKPTIILAEKGTKLPFDISPFRVLFYENSIIGRARFEDGLRRHLSSIINV